MKICIITDSWTPLWGGGQEHILQTSNRLINTYHCKVDIVAPNLLSKSNFDSPNIHRVGQPFIFPNIFGRLGYLASTFYFLLSGNYDIYHSQSHDSLFLMPFVKLFKPKAKFVYTVHGKPITPIKFLWDLMVNKFPFDALLTAAKSSAPNAIVIGNGVNVSDFDKVASSKSKNKFKIIWVGREGDPIKGVKFLKEAFEILKKKYPKMELNLVSGKTHQEVIRELKSSNLFVLPSLSEGLPLVILEAMAARLPIVTTNVGDCKELIDKSGAGIVVKPGDSKLLADGIEAVYKDSSSMGERGYEFVKKNYDWDKITAKLYEIYGQLA